MPDILPVVGGVLLSAIFICAVWREVICISRNPFPLFHNKDKRFKEIEKKKTRSILQDINNV